MLITDVSKGPEKILFPVAVAASHWCLLLALLFCWCHLRPLLCCLGASARGSSWSGCMACTRRLPAKSQSCAKPHMALFQMCSPGLVFKKLYVQFSFHGNDHLPRDKAAMNWSFPLKLKECMILGLKSLAQSVLFKTNVSPEKVRWIAG